MSGSSEFISIKFHGRTATDRGPFLIRRLGVPIGMRSTREAAEAAADKSERFTTEVLANAIRKAGKRRT